MNITLDLTKILLIFIILSILGLNIFYYLAKTTHATSELAKKTIQTGIETGKQTIETSKQGTQYGLEIARKSLTGGIQQLQLHNDINQPSNIIHYENDKNEMKYKNDLPRQVEPNDTTVSYPQKRGYCYIGQEDGYRSCIYVGPNDMCMSQQIYPTMDVCINPSLRV